MARKTLNTQNKVETPESVVLYKKCVIVYTVDGYIVLKDYNNQQCWPGVGKLYAEFDTEQELEDFITENNLEE